MNDSKGSVLSMSFILGISPMNGISLEVKAINFSIINAGSWILDLNSFKSKVDHGFVGFEVKNLRLYGFAVDDFEWFLLTYNSTPFY